MTVISFKMEINNRSEEIKLDLDEQRGCERDILRSLQSGQIYEPEVTSTLLRILRTGDTFLDIGANIGFYSILGSKLVGADGHVIAFEADTENHAALVKHVQLNMLENIEAICKPITAKIEKRSFFINADDAGGHALWDPALMPVNTKSAETPISTIRETMTVDRFFNTASDLQYPKVIKIDIEGAEELALRGASNLLKQSKVPYIICELHEFGLAQMGGSQASLRSFMSDLGYEMFTLSMDGRLPKLIPKGVELRSEFIANVLFSKPHYLAHYWPHDIYFHRK